MKKIFPGNMIREKNEYGYTLRSPQVWSTNSKKANLDLNPHYSNPDFSKGQLHDVFGQEEKGIHYVYSDRFENRSFLYYCVQRAVDEGAAPSSAEAWENGLRLYTGCKVDLKNIKVGVNVSNGYAYQVFGFNSEGSWKNNELATEWQKECEIQEEFKKKVTEKKKKIAAISHKKSSLESLRKKLVEMQAEIAKLQGEQAADSLEEHDLTLELEEMFENQEYKYPVPKNYCGYY